MARLKPLDAWGVNNEVLSLELFCIRQTNASSSCYRNPVYNSIGT
jgi:hypothetical protein